ncbi:MAG: LLM class flavin-dependent oxidoreductase [Chloroflexi bacterium]|nr:LLM class flavin-dependent oxidoreductase [Chloroflexota bacterium]MDA1226442.1 LLM class flavin-dependent oxidoreductase [Chloroflexota bacterium]
MKFCMFHLMPYRDLPDNFENDYHSVCVDVPSNLYDPVKGSQMYNDALDELVYADKMGIDGVCVNEHHSHMYGMMPSPNLMAAALARETEDAAVIVLGNSLPLYNPAIRVAEEFAMLDAISGGRVIAGFPVGSSHDTNYSYGKVPATLREQYREAHDLIIQSWTRDDVFSFNGKYNQLRYVNVLPKPMQKPHPPIWVPGGGSIETWDFCLENDYVYCYLSYSGYENGKSRLQGFWDRADELGYEKNPFRAGFLQLVVVSETDEQAEKDYAKHALYFFKKCLHTYPGFAEAPGYRTMETISRDVRSVYTNLRRQQSSEWTYRDYVEAGNIIAGSPDTVRERLKEAITGLNVGNLMVLLHIGSMPKELTEKNIRLFTQEVMPGLKDMWSDWDNRWWIKPVGQQSDSMATPAD